MKCSFSLLVFIFSALILSGCGGGGAEFEPQGGIGNLASSDCLNCHGSTYSTSLNNAIITNSGAFIVNTSEEIAGAPTLSEILGDITDTHYDNWRVLANGTFISNSTPQIEGYVLDSTLTWAPEGQGYVSQLNPNQCYASCHDYHNIDTEIHKEWYASGHANVLAGAFTSPFVQEGVCQRCHSSIGFANYVSSDNTDYPMWNTTSIPKALHHITCNACHDAVGYPNSDNPRLRKIGIANFISGNVNSVATEFTSYEGAVNAGNSASCIVCHQGYNSGAIIFNSVQAKSADPCNGINNTLSGVSGFMAFTNYDSHYLTSASILFGVKGFEYNATSVTPGTYTSGNPFHQSMLCVGCHMSEGDHEMKPKISVCQKCHGPVKSFDEIGAFRDMDGDGVANRPKVEIEGLKAKVNQELASRGITVTPTFPYYIKFSPWEEYEIEAAFNTHFIHEDPGAYVHNFRYAVQLLRDSYAILTGSSLPGVRPSTGDDRQRAGYWNSCP